VHNYNYQKAKQLNWAGYKPSLVNPQNLVSLVPPLTFGHDIQMGV